MHFHPSLASQYICVYNDGHAAGVNKKGKPFKATKPNHIRFWQNKAKIRKFTKKYPELGIYVITSIIAKEIEDQ